MWISPRRRRQGFSAVELVCVLAVAALLLVLVRQGYQRVLGQRERAATRAYLAAIDAAKLEWQAQHPEATPETEPPESAIVALLSANGRVSLSALSELGARTGGRIFFINALGVAATCKPALVDDVTPAEPAPTATPSPRPTPTLPPTGTPAPTATPPPLVTPTPQATATATPEPTPTAPPTPSPAITPTPTALPTAIPTAGPTPTVPPSPTSTPPPSTIPPVQRSPTATPVPTVVPTSLPTPVPTPEPTLFPTPRPTGHNEN